MSVIAFPTAAPFGTQSDQPLRVLREDLSSRVAAVNTVRTLLRRCGFQIAAQDLINGGARPLLLLASGDAQCLRSAAQAVRSSGGVCTYTINGVDVQPAIQAPQGTTAIHH